MKLRNKRTGKIIDGCFVVCEYDDGARFSVKDKPVFDSLAELNDDWEDYTPQEPLIKDEKIRKAVSLVFGDKDCVFIEKEESYIRFASTSCELTFHGVYIEPLLAHKTAYTIAELCGEEE